MTERLVVAAALLLASAPLLAQDPHPVECSYLAGTQQNTVRYAQQGWQLPRIVEIELGRKEYAKLNRNQQELVVRVIEETYNAGYSRTVRECFAAARRSADGDGAPR